MRAVRVGQLIAFVGAALFAVAPSASCSSSYGQDPDSSSDAGPGEAAVMEDAEAGEAGKDAATVTDAAVTLPLPCPPAKAGTTPPRTWASRELYRPAERMYPFAIVTDATHVTWLAQPAATDGGNDDGPYNGSSNAIVLRAPKNASAKPVVLARDQPKATALALDGDAVYWTTYASNVATLVRQRHDADCDAGCGVPDVVAQFPNGNRIGQLVRAAPGVLFAISGNAQLFRIQIGSGGATGISLTQGIFPSMAATSTHVFTSATSRATVQRTTVSVPPATDDPYFAIPPLDAGDVGATPIATDCTWVWMMRGKELARHDVAVAGTYSSFRTLPTNAFGLVADAKYVYAAAPNDGGVFVVDPNVTDVVRLYQGNVFALAVDDDGVYFGEHAPGLNSGTMTMLVKE